MTHTIYLLLHKPTSKFYIGSTVDLDARKRQWRQAFQHPEALPIRISSLSEVWAEWTFHKLVDFGAGAWKIRLKHERGAIKRARKKHGDRVLNTQILTPRK